MQTSPVARLVHGTRRSGPPWPAVRDRTRIVCCRPGRLSCSSFDGRLAGQPQFSRRRPARIHEPQRVRPHQGRDNAVATPGAADPASADAATCRGLIYRCVMSCGGFDQDVGQTGDMSAILTTLLGGLLAISGGLVGIALNDRRERTRWFRDAQLKASTDLLSALQLLVRRMINVAYLDPSAWMSQDSLDPKKWKDQDPKSAPEVAAFVEATVGWNNALYGALLIAPPSVATKIPELDREVDRLLDLAVSRIWTRTEFRRERASLGRMAAEYLRLARNLAGLPDIELPSIWTWDLGLDRAS
jgi:hypothetical protein